MARRRTGTRGRRKRHRQPPWRLIVAALALLIAAFGARAWLRAHPYDNPWAPLAITDPVSWTTRAKLAPLVAQGDACRTLLRNAGVRIHALDAVGTGHCRAPWRTQIRSGGPVDYAIVPDGVAPSCAVSASLLLWMRDVVQPAARARFGSSVRRIEHLGSYNCRPIRGGSTQWSEHATGNAIDIAAFVLADGRRIVLTRDWNGQRERAAFLRDVRDGACTIFATVLSPDYNAAHANHFHLDQAQRPARWPLRSTVCR